jgi:hypothetical protein
MRCDVIDTGVNVMLDDAAGYQYLVAIKPNEQSSNSIDKGLKWSSFYIATWL